MHHNNNIEKNNTLYILVLITVDIYFAYFFNLQKMILHSICEYHFFPFLSLMATTLTVLSFPG